MTANWEEFTAAQGQCTIAAAAICKIRSFERAMLVFEV